MIRAIILDDEQPSVDKLERLLGESGMVEIKAKFTESIKALEFLKKTKVDVIFMDIEMPDMDGIELSNHIIDLQNKAAVVFVTAYNQYAVEAFRLNALDFLMKPVNADRLKETLKRIIAEREIPMHSEELQVRSFGKFCASTGAGEIRFRTEKAEELFAFLIDRRSSFASRSRIIDSLWEDYDGDRALIHFNTTLHYIKKALLQNGIQAPIEHDRGSYRINISRISSDYCSFYGFASRLPAISDVNICDYEAAAGLYTGEYLSGMELSWVERNRQMLRDLYIGLLLKITGYYKACGENEKIIEWMKTGLAHEPLHRELNYRLIEALLLTENRISALRYYNMYKMGLRKKMSQEPDNAFNKLMQ